MVLAICFFVGFAFGSFEGGVAVVFGWISFLGRVVPRVSLDWPSIWVGVGAVALFTVGIHVFGRSWRTHPTSEASVPRQQWRIRFTFSVVVIAIVAFVAGISIIGAIHQVGWLVRAEPYGEGLRHQWGTPVSTLKIIGLAMQSQHDSHRRFPAGGTFTADGAMLHSWETKIIWVFPYSTEGIDMARPFNDPVNQRYFKCILPEFINPGFRTAALEDSEGYGLSHYAANSWVLSGNKSMKLADIKDGSANTLLVGEVNAQFKPWGHPVNWRDPTDGINRSPHGFGGPPGSLGTNFAMADASVRFVSERISPDVLRALSTPSGGEEIPKDGWEER